MKKDIHPQFNKDIKAKCACGAEFVVSSTLDEMSVEVCSQCHPFYTGKERMMDTTGRAEKFKQRQAKAQEKTKKNS